jgi:glutamyl-Q tRNA(Asp) synthetase
MAKAMDRAGPLFWSETGAPAEAAEATQARPDVWGDVVLARKETPTSYHMAVVVDDALQGITHVVRGQDLFAATSVHRLLQSLLGLPSPHYGHHRLMLDGDGRKLAKSTGAVALRTLRQEGANPADIRAMIGLA